MDLQKINELPSFSLKKIRRRIYEKVYCKLSRLLFWLCLPFLLSEYTINMARRPGYIDDQVPGEFLKSFLEARSNGQSR